MKRILCIISIPLLLLCGCEYDNTPLQAVVNKYNTDEVKFVGNHMYVVRGTNGAIWYVETQTSGMNSNGNYEYYCVRNTLLFDPIKKVDKPKLEE